MHLYHNLILIEPPRRLLSALVLQMRACHRGRVQPFLMWRIMLFAYGGRRHATVTLYVVVRVLLLYN